MRQAGRRALAAAIAWALAAAVAPAAPRPPRQDGTFVLELDGDRVACRERPGASPLAERDASRLHELPRRRTCKTGPGLTIVLRATDQLERSPQAVAAFERAAEIWEDTITGTPMTI